uniref:ribonuclease H n=1 Tax=Nothobranchius furzeri TaxID=105023 RepID=A0A8C6M011_NOTFU
MSWVKKLPPRRDRIIRPKVDSIAESNSSVNFPPVVSETLSRHQHTIHSLLKQVSDSHQRLLHVSNVLHRLTSKLTPPEPSDQSPPVSPPSAHPVPSPVIDFRIPSSLPLETYSGEFGRCRGFLFSCQLAFKRSPEAFVSDSVKISYIIGLLRGKALDWAEARSHDAGFLSGSLSRFLTKFNKTFDHSESPAEIAKKLWNLHQGDQTVADFAIEFRTLAAISSLDHGSLLGAFTQALNDRLQDQLALCQEPPDLESLISLAFKIEKRLKERSRGSPVSLPPLTQSKDFLPQVTAPSGDETRQRGRTKLTPEERQCRFASNLCLYCGQPGHRLSSCTLRLKGAGPPVVPGILVGANETSESRCTLSCAIMFKQGSCMLKALLDSGCERNMLDNTVVQKLNIPTIPLPTPLKASSLDGGTLTTITHQTVPVNLLVSGNHQESISFFVFPSPHSPVVLGHDWLVTHNPQINWRTSQVVVWSSHCLTNCLRSASPSSSAPTPDPPVPPDLSGVPEEYHDLSLVFSKDRASSLPPHRPYDCAIDLLPGAPLPSSRLNNLSKPEQVCMSTYIQESLASGLIRPSTSPLGAGFFFVSKKDGSLRPCIDYRGLNQITVKNRYPLPLLSSTFEPVQDATIFTKLDLHNAYHLVRVKEGDEWKTAFKTPLGHFEYLVMPFGLTNAPAVFQSLVNSVLGDYLNQFVTVYLDDILIFSKSPTEHRQHVRAVLQRLLENHLYVKAEKCEFHVPSVKFLGFILESGRLKTDPDKIQSVLSWPTPTTRKQLQRFLGFANFYRRFIKNYSQTAAPLTQLTS